MTTIWSIVGFLICSLFGLHRLSDIVLDQIRIHRELIRSGLVLDLQELLGRLLRVLVAVRGRSGRRIDCKDEDEIVNLEHYL